MDSIDLEVLKACECWLAEGKRCELITVVKTWGSSPRPEGAMLAIAENGQVVGSVSGGCIEDDLIARVQNGGCTRILPEIVTYGISADEAHRFGLPCGGTIQLAIEPLHANSQVAALLARLAQHELVARELNLLDGSVTLRNAATDDALKLSERHLLSTGLVGGC
jgi:xanthine dehydrogenase accessory factor